MQEGAKLFFTFTDDGKVIKEQTDFPARAFEYKLRGNVIYFSDDFSDEEEVDSAYITFENDYLMLNGFVPRDWSKFKKTD